LQKIKPTIAILAALAGLSTLQGASVVFTDFQAGICCSLGVNNVGLSPQSLAGQFTPNANYTMVDAQVKVEENGTQVPTFNLFLYTDSGGAPGSSLGSIGGGTAPGAFGIVLAPSPAFYLVSGTPYWLVMTPNSGSNVFWAGGGSPGPLSLYDTNPSGNAPWFVPGPAPAFQFQIDGTLVPAPEPATAALAIAALACICAARRQKPRT
jgi:hypothetical protein